MCTYYGWLILFVVSAAANSWVSAANIADFADYSLRNPSGQVVLAGAALYTARGERRSLRAKTTHGLPARRRRQGFR